MLSCMAFFASCTHAIYSTEYNLDFEYAKNDSVPSQWLIRNPAITGYVLSLDKQVKRHGNSSFKAQWDENISNVGITSWGGFQNFMPTELVAGKELEVSGWVRTEDIANVCAGYGIFAYVPGKSKMGFMSEIDTLGGVRGTSEWKRHKISKTIEEDASSIMIAGFVSGKGTAWFDDMEIRIDGKKYEGRRIPALKTELSEKDIQDLKKYVYPLRTYEPDGGDTRDLNVLDGMIGTSKVVGLGEYTHGTSEIYKMKHRLVRYLAEQCGFATFAIESNFPEGFRMNDYTVRGVGDPKQLIRGMYVWPWMTDEMLGLVEWMREYNASEPKITFAGVDMQMHTTLMQNLLQQIEDCPEAYRVTRLISDKLQQIYPRPYQINEELAQEIDADLKKLVLMAEIQALPSERKECAIQYIDLLHQFLSQTEDIDWRDRGMAKNTEWLLERHPETKILLWAHNQHINLKEGMTSMSHPSGYFLKKKLNDDYLAIGFMCYEGEFTAWQGKLKACALPAPSPGTLEYVLEQLDEPIFLLDLKRMREEQSPAISWIDDLEYREIGATSDPFYKKDISKSFDCLIYIRNSSASHIMKFQ